MKGAIYQSRYEFSPRYLSLYLINDLALYYEKFLHCEKEFLDQGKIFSCLRRKRFHEIIWAKLQRRIYNSNKMLQRSIT